jgi:hypothetical protein
MRQLRTTVCAIFLTLPLLAQSDRGTITGTVSDPAGAVVASAALQARNVENGAIYEAASTATGNYTLAQLPAGTYELTVTVPGFKKFVRQGLGVQVAQVMRIDIALEVGSASESVTVTEAAPLLKTESGELSHNVTSQRLDDLPILSPATGAIRSPMAVMQLAPGTFYTPGSDWRVNGAPASSGSIRVEGLDATNGYNSDRQAQTQPSVDSIEETSIQTSNFAAEFGQAGGGVFNLTMKSGTNLFHGSVYDYFVNEVLNAGTPFTDDGHGNLLRPSARRNDYGFTVGGPVRIPRVYDGRNSTFFFFSWEQQRANQLINNQVNTVPTPAYRAGNFAEALTGRTLATDPLGRSILEGAIYDPSTQRLASNGQIIRDQFPANQIPLGRMDPVAQKVQALIPLPTLPGLVNNGIYPYLSERLNTIPALKLDQNLGSKRKLSFYWSHTGSTAPFAPGSGNAEGFPVPITAARGTYIYSHIERLSYDESISPTLLLHLAGGFQYLTFDDHAPELNYDAFKELGLKGTTGVRQFPYFSGLTAARGGVGNLGAFVQAFNTLNKPTFNASLTWVKNNHTYKFGGDFRTEGYPWVSFSNISGSFAFATTQTTLPSTSGQNLQGGTVGFPYASFFLGLVNTGNISVPSGARNGKWQLGTFVQDSWKITRKLTLDYGLRWDYSTYYHEQYGRLPNLSATTPNPSAGGMPGATIYEGNLPGRCQCQFAKNYPYAFGPRIGAAYQITPKTVLRAGFGIVYNGTANGGGAASASSSNPFSSPAFGDPAMVLANGLPFTPVWPVISPGAYPLPSNPGALTGVPIVVDQNAGRPARQVQWSVGVQRELFRNLAVEASYVANTGAWWPAGALVSYNANTIEGLKARGLDVALAGDRTILASPLTSAAAIARGFGKAPYNGFPLSSTVAQALRPFPQYASALTPQWSPLGRTWYESLQFKVTKRYSYGLDFTYTLAWQKQLYMGSEADRGGFAAAVNDVFNRPQNKYLSGYDQPITTVLAANYTLQKWQLAPGAAGNALSWALRDWQVGAVLQYASGLPIRVPLANNQLAASLFRGTNANRVPGVPLFTQDINCHCFDPNTTFILNPAAWADPAPGTWGTSAAYYTDYRGQRRPNEAMSLGRLFRFKEGMSLQIRMEFTNVFNRARFADPTSTNAQATQTRAAPNGQTISGFGWLNTQITSLTTPTPVFTVNNAPRQGLIVVRFRF